MKRRGTPRSPQIALIAQGLKRCAKCREVKPLADYDKNPRAGGGVQSLCKICARKYLRESYFRRFYGITLEEYDAILKKQKGVCAICKKPPNAFGRDRKTIKPLAVDHDHDSGAVRALLCHSCNTALGHFGHDIQLLEAAIEYLRQPRLF